MMPLGGCCRRPYPELPAGEVKGCASEPWREKLPHLLSASGGRRGRLTAPAGLGERRPSLQLSNPSMHNHKYNKYLIISLIPFHETGDNSEKYDAIVFCSWQGQCAIVSSINDRNDWKTVKNALQIINIDDINTNVSWTNSLSPSVLRHLTIVLSVQHLFGIVASVLHLGNVQFVSDSKDHALLDNKAELRWVSNVRKEKKKKDEKSLNILSYKRYCTHCILFIHAAAWSWCQQS